MALSYYPTVPPYQSFMLVLSALRGQSGVATASLVKAVWEITGYSCWLTLGDPDGPQSMRASAVEGSDEQPRLLTQAEAEQELEQAIDAGQKVEAASGPQAMLAVPYITQHLAVFLAQWLLQRVLDGTIKKAKE